MEIYPDFIEMYEKIKKIGSGTFGNVWLVRKSE